MDAADDADDSEDCAVCELLEACCCGAMDADEEAGWCSCWSRCGSAAGLAWLLGPFVLKEKLDTAEGRRKAFEENHAAVDVVGHRIHLDDEPEAMMAIEEPRTRDACFAIIV